MTTFVPLTTDGVNRFDDHVRDTTDAPLTGLSLDTIQVNIGLRCNLACHHCHVESSPTRREEMDAATMDAVLAAAQRAGAQTLDITGGAPEIHPRFREFVTRARAQGLAVIVRTNLTILLEDGFTDLPAFFRQQQVQLVASLPCYLEQNVDRQRGKHTYAGSITALQRLNAEGFGREPHLRLDLVYNPLGPGLPPAQADLEADYRRELADRFSIVFTSLITITNMPIGRFLHDLQRDGREDAYWELLENSFNPATLERLMCRHQVNVRWDGVIFDCDFNLALDLPAVGALHIRDFDPEHFRQRRIATGRHCLGCAAGNGSSCSGALV